MMDPSPRTAPLTLGSAWRQRAGRTPQRTALIFDDVRWSYADLDRAARQAAAQLIGRGLLRGDRAILMMENGPAFVAAFLGCQLIGAIPVPISPQARVQRVRDFLADSEAELLVVEPSLPERVRSLHRAQEYGARVVVVEPQQGSLDLPRLEVDREARVDPEDCALIQYTAGTGGDARGAMLSHRALLANIRAFGGAAAAKRGDVYSSLLPLFHPMGLVCFGLAPLLAGVPLVLHRGEPSSLHAWLAGIGRYRVTITGAPDRVLRLANRAIEEPARYDLGSLRMLICGGEPVQRDSIETFGSRFGVLHAIKPAYGTAELGFCAAATAAHERAHIDAQGHVACGRPLHGVEIGIARDDGSLTREPGVRGEIRLRSPAVMTGYWMRTQESAAAFDRFGYLRTGDLGYLDAYGCLYVVGRQDSLLTHGDRQVAPHGMEAAANEWPAIRRAAVVQSRLDAARVVAVLEVDRLLLQDSAALHDLSHAFRRIARERSGIAPDRCWFVAHGRLPATDDGRLRHAALRTQIDRGQFAPDGSDIPPSERAVAQLATLVS